MRYLLLVTATHAILAYRQQFHAIQIHTISISTHVLMHQLTFSSIDDAGCIRTSVLKCRFDSFVGAFPKCYLCIPHIFINVRQSDIYHINIKFSFFLPGKEKLFTFQFCSFSLHHSFFFCFCFVWWCAFAAPKVYIRQTSLNHNACVYAPRNVQAESF